MLTDYKFWYIKRDDLGFITEAVIRFYEGDLTTLVEETYPNVFEPVTRYRRSKKLKQIDLPHLTDKTFKKDAKNNDAVVYTSKDFGNIKTDNELRTFLNKETDKDPTRTPIKEQKIVVKA